MENLKINCDKSVMANAQNKNFNKTEMAIAKLTDFTKKYAESKIFTSEIQYGGLTPELLSKIKWRVYGEDILSQFFNLYPEYKHISQDKLIDAIRNAYDEVFDNYQFTVPSFQSFVKWANNSVFDCFNILETKGLGGDTLHNFFVIADELTERKSYYIEKYSDHPVWTLIQRFVNCVESLQNVYEDMCEMASYTWKI
jgi:hypothetical protein